MEQRSFRSYVRRMPVRDVLIIIAAALAVYLVLCILLLRYVPGLLQGEVYMIAASWGIVTSIVVGMRLFRRYMATDRS